MSPAQDSAPNAEEPPAKKRKKKVMATIVINCDN